MESFLEIPGDEADGQLTVWRLQPREIGRGGGTRTWYQGMLNRANLQVRGGGIVKVRECRENARNRIN